ncbi:hypothetical protein E1B28_011679 [Marasmius oreades]|uniref:Uncharacterized protein n=1 Tax=Marasmius oreades TaxID=181124 RepID=A0A9P7UPU6_9AGAR|nr:uncharacterized protein E1B28_011679 [Marasmius oreades]KAG7090062.1 hypothetical protein E1B28_011679 [Marasmius oreades]
MSTSLLTVPSLLDRFSLSSSSQSSSSSYSFFGSNIDGFSDSHTEPEPEPQSPLSSKQDIKTRVISPQVHTTPKPSHSLVRRILDNDRGYESDLEENKNATAPRRKKAKKKRIRQQQMFGQLSLAEEPLVGLGLNLKRPPPPKGSRITRPAVPQKPVLHATDLLNSPSPVIPLPSPVVSLTKSLDPIRPVDSTSSVSPLLMSSPLLVSTVFQRRAPSSPLPLSRL